MIVITPSELAELKAFWAADEADILQVADVDRLCSILQALALGGQLTVIQPPQRPGRGSDRSGA